MPSIFGGIITGELINLTLFSCAKVNDLADFVWTVLIPTVRIASTLLIAYWVWQEYNVCLFFPSFHHHLELHDRASVVLSSPVTVHS